jgi:8-oxo-dGTP diphosphatase
MSRLRNRAVPAAYAILRRQGAVLLARRRGTGFYDGFYSLPAGHVEAGELPAEALAREMREELGISFRREDALPRHVMYRTRSDETGDRVDLLFEIVAWRGEPENREPHKCDDLRWFKMSELPTDVVPHVRTVLIHIRNSVIYSELTRAYFEELHVESSPSC